jgi:bifunctional non-homologous end joining protein LigD
MEELVTRYSQVQLATLADAPPEGGQWLHEIKYDGYRLLAFLEQDDVKLYTRNGNDWTRRFPAVRASIAQVKASSAVLDMEAVVTEPSGRTSFHALQQSLGNNGNSAAIIAYVFDVLYLDGQDLSATPQIERKNRLATLFKQSQGANALHYSEHVIGNGAAMLAHACELGLEGIVSKRADAPYRTGRQRSWLKAKCIKRQEFIIVGFSAAQAGFRAIGALYLGYMKEDQLTYAGKVGTGYTMEEAAGLYQKLAAMEVKTPAAIGFPRAEARYIHWVRPELLCEVAFVEWTEEGHIRHGSFQGLREDKQAGTVQREMPKPVKKAVLTHPSRARPAGLAKAEAADPVFEGYHHPSWPDH